MAELQHLSLLRPAETLADAAITLDPAPLVTDAEMNAFYRTEIQSARGVDRLGRIRIDLEDALRWERQYKAFLMGHPGVGKTTELLRLTRSFEAQLEPLYISVISELNPGSFRYYDVLLLILVRLVEAASSPTRIGFEEHKLKLLLKRVQDCLTGKWNDYLQTREANVEVGFDVFFAKIKGTLKQGRTFKKDEQRFEASFVTELVDLMNDVFDECNEMAQKANGKRWIVILDDLEKLGIEQSPLQTLFSGLRASLQDLRMNMIFTIPVWLHFSKDANDILPSNFQRVVLPDIPVYNKDKQLDSHSVRALTEVIHSRIEPSLLEDGVAERCIRGSGGSLRDLFRLLRDGIVTARIRGASKVALPHVEEAIRDLRNDYKNRLGSTSQADAEVTLEQKIERLVQIYKREDATAEVPDPVLYNLLRQRFVLQYNGTAWMGIHSLAVDLLIQFKRLESNSPGGSTL